MSDETEKLEVFDFSDSEKMEAEPLELPVELPEEKKKKEPKERTYKLRRASNVRSGFFIVQDVASKQYFKLDASLVNNEKEDFYFVSEQIYKQLVEK